MVDQIPIPAPPFVNTGSFQRFGSIEDLTGKFLRDNYMKGIVFVDENGKPYDDTWYEQKINVALSTFEHNTQLTLTPRLLEGEPHDYYFKDYQMFAFIQLYHYPLIVTNEHPLVKAVYPTGQVITTFPREWVRPDAAHGQIQLIPTQGTLSQVILGQGGSYLPIIYQGLSYLPQLFHVTYKAGFESGKVPQMFLDALAKLATIGVYSSVGDSVHPTGITNQSISVDGLSESRGYQNSNEFSPVFSGTIAQYKRELFGDDRTGARGLLADTREYYRGVNLWVTS